MTPDRPTGPATAAGRNLLGALTHFSMRLGPDRYHADPRAAAAMISAIESEAGDQLRAALGWALDELDLCVTRLRENHGYVLATYEAGRDAARAALKEQPRISPETRERVEREMKDDLWARLGEEHPDD